MLEMQIWELVCEFEKRKIISFLLLRDKDLTCVVIQSLFLLHKPQHMPAHRHFSKYWDM